MNIKTKLGLIAILFVFNLTSFYLFFKNLNYKGIIKISFDKENLLLIQDSSIQVVINPPSDKELVKKLKSYIPFYDKKIEVVILPSIEYRNYKGFIKLISYFEIENLLITGEKKDSQYFKDLLSKAKSKKVKLIFVDSSTKVIIKERIIIEVLWPIERVSNIKTKNNKNSFMVILINYNKNKILVFFEKNKFLENFLLEKYKDKLENIPILYLK